MRKNWPQRKLILIALGVFLSSAFLAIIVNSVAKYGFDISRSISRYVGFEYWSATVFTLANLVVAGLIMRYLWQLAEVWKMPRVFYYALVLMAACLIWLSVCPIGLTDVAGETSVISLMHELASRTMFLTMMLAAFLIAVSKKANTAAKIGNGIFVVYGLVCVVGYLLQADWFISYTMIYETVFLTGFMLAIALCGKSERKI